MIIDRITSLVARFRPPKDEVVRAYHRRVLSIAYVFVIVQLFIVGFGTGAVEGTNMLRAYAAAQTHWAMAQKSAVVALQRYVDTGAQSDYEDFLAALRIDELDRASRDFLDQRVPDHAAASRVLLEAGNDPADVSVLVNGYLLFRRWPPYEATTEDWRRGDELMHDLGALGAHLHGQVKRGDNEHELDAQLGPVHKLDIAISRNESRYAHHMSEASHFAVTLALVVFALLSILACEGGIWFTWRILRKGKEANRRATESDERMRDFAALSSDWFGELDAVLNIKYISFRMEGAEKQAARLIGWNWFDVGNHDDAREAAGGHRAAMHAHLPFRDHRVRIMSRNGHETHWVASGKPLFDELGNFTGYRIVASDISGYLNTQKDLMRARDEAQQANRAKSAFLANMSHELRTPLNAIIGFSQMIEQQQLGAIRNMRYVGYANDIRASGQHLLELINDLLDHSRVEAGQLVLRHGPFDVADAIEGARHICQERADATGVTLYVETPPAIHVVTGDELRLKQVLINLIANAIKFSPGGEVRVTTRRDGTGTLRIEVRDNGIGMDEDGIALALQPFGQVDSGLNRQYEGTGLGLPLSKSLVELQGGTLEITSAPGDGTCVTITLPLAAHAEKIVA
jgi:signal transduction histidine kinase